MAALNTSYSAEAFVSLCAHLERAAQEHGGTLSKPHLLTPMQVHVWAAGDAYRLGVLSALVEVVAVLGRSSAAREALPDLVFEPVFEDVERPGCGGRDDA